MIDQDIVQSSPERSYVDWAAIFAGTAVSSGVAVVLTTFAAGLGLSSISVDKGGEFSVVWMVITALFLIVSMVASYMLGGYITGRMRRPTGTSTREEATVRDGLNGLVVWGIGIVLAGFLAASAISGGVKAVGSAAQTAVEATGSIVGGTAQGVGQLTGDIISGAGATLGGVAQGAGEAAGPTLDELLPQSVKSNPLDYLADTLLRATSPMPSGTEGTSQYNAGAEQRQIAGILGNLLRTGEISDADRNWISTEISARTGLSQEDAQIRLSHVVEQVQGIRTEAVRKVDEAEKKIAAVKSKAEEALEKAKSQAAEAAEKIRVASILSAFLLAASALVAAAAAYIGAVHGGRHRDEGRIWGGLAYRR